MAASAAALCSRHVESAWAASGAAVATRASRVSDGMRMPPSYAAPRADTTPARRARPSLRRAAPGRAGLLLTRNRRDASFRLTSRQAIGRVAAPKTDLLQGTLDLIVLKLLRAGPANGWELTQSIQ